MPLTWGFRAAGTGLMGFGVPGRAVDLEPVMLLSSASRTTNGGS
jgi:hypothetical protein